MIGVYYYPEQRPEDQSRILRAHIDEQMWITHNFMNDYPHHFPGPVGEGLAMYTLTIYPVAGLYKGVQGRQLQRTVP